MTELTRYGQLWYSFRTGNHEDEDPSVTDITTSVAALNASDSAPTQTVAARNLRFEDLLLLDDQALLVEQIEILQSNSPQRTVVVYFTDQSGEPGDLSLGEAEQVEIALRDDERETALREAETWYRRADAAEYGWAA